MKQGWEWKKLGDVCQIELGRTPHRGTARYWDPKMASGNVWLSISDLPTNGSLFVKDSKEQVSDIAAETMKLVPHGTPLVSFKLTLGRIAIAGCDLYTNEAIAALYINSESQLDRSFLLYSLSFFDWHAAAEGDEKVKGKTFNKAKLKEIPIALPHLEEQKSIVAVLDEAFERLETARTNAQANIKNVEDLLVSTFDGAFRDLSNTCHLKKLTDVCAIQSGSGFPKKYQGKSDGLYPFYKVSDMNLVGNEYCLNRALNYIEEAERATLGAKLFPSGACVFPKVGGAILTNKKRMVFKEGCTDNNVMGLLPIGEMMSSEYLHLWLRTQELYDWSNKANPPSITQGTVANIELPLPTIIEQENVVKRLEELGSETSNLFAEYTAQIENLEELRRSFLQKAFAGELT